MLDSRMESAGRSGSEDRIGPRSSAPTFSATCLLIPVLIFLSLMAGCSAFSRDGDSGMMDISSILKPGSIRGPLERRLYGEENPLEMGRRFSAEERKQVEAARLAYDRGEYDQSIKLCKKAAKKFKESSLGEEAQFYLAESYYAKGEYGKAQDGYDQLFEDYPSTRYIEPATRRLFVCDCSRLAGNRRSGGEKPNSPGQRRKSN